MRSAVKRKDTDSAPVKLVAIGMSSSLEAKHLRSYSTLRRRYALPLPIKIDHRHSRSINKTGSLFFATLGKREAFRVDAELADETGEGGGLC